MDSNTLFACLKVILKGTMVKKCFVIAADEFPKISNVSETPICVISNTSNRVDGPGTHWIGYYIYNSNFNTIIIDVFDSYGKNLTKYNINLPFNVAKQNINSYQAPTSTVCGLYCLYFLYFRSRGVSLKTISLKFNNNRIFNDEIVVKFYKNIKHRCVKSAGQICCNR